MGVPVITLCGHLHAGRVGKSLLGQLGLDELVAGSPEEYCMMAVRLAGDPATLAHYRKTLRARVSASALTDERGFTHDLEDIYRSVLDSYNPDIPQR